MNPEQQTNDITFYISIISGALLTVSEIMPYISQIKGNGIVQVLINTFSKYEEKKKQEEQSIHSKLQEICSHLENIEKNTIPDLCKRIEFLEKKNS
jgi:hypothetical protein